MRRIADLYTIEADIRGRAAEQRLVARRELSRPLVEALHTWLNGLPERLFGRSTLAQAVRYALNR